MNYNDIFILGQRGRGLIKEYVAIPVTAIEDGLISSLPCSVFVMYIVLFSRVDEDNKGEFEVPELATKTGLSLNETEETLVYLERLGLIRYKRNGNYLGYDLKSLSAETFEEKEELEIDSLEQEERFLSELLSGRPVSEQELVKGLVMILAPKQLTPQLRSEIEDIMDTFSSELVKELIRRIKKAADENPGLKALPYLRAIIKDWLAADLSSYEDLQRADRLHRETQELAQAFGLQGGQRLAPSHKETLLSWITQRDNKDFALSLEVAKMAIDEAIRRKKDGRPSLDYVERNFIIPWKKARLTSLAEVNTYLGNEKGKRKETNKNKTKKDWSYTEFLDN